MKIYEYVSNSLTLKEYDNHAKVKSKIIKTEYCMLDFKDYDLIKKFIACDKNMTGEFIITSAGIFAVTKIKPEDLLKDGYSELFSTEDGIFLCVSNGIVAYASSFEDANYEDMEYVLYNLNSVDSYKQFLKDMHNEYTLSIFTSKGIFPLANCSEQELNEKGYRQMFITNDNRYSCMTDGKLCVATIKYDPVVFWVAECEEFKSKGRVYDKLSFEEAMNTYNNLLKNSKIVNMGPGLGFTTDDGAITLMTGQFIFSGLAEMYIDNYEEIIHRLKENIPNAVVI